MGKQPIQYVPCNWKWENSQCMKILFCVHTCMYCTVYDLFCVCQALGTFDNCGKFRHRGKFRQRLAKFTTYVPCNWKLENPQNIKIIFCVVCIIHFGPGKRLGAFDNCGKFRQSCRNFPHGWEVFDIHVTCNWKWENSHTWKFCFVYDLCCVWQAFGNFQ